MKSMAFVSHNSLCKTTQRLQKVLLSTAFAAACFFTTSCQHEAANARPDQTVYEKLSDQAASAASFGIVGFATQNGGTSGGSGGRTVTATSLSDFTTYAQSTEKLIIRVDRKILAGTAGASVRVNSNKTILGIGASGFLEGVGLNISSKKNIIIQNIKFTMSTVTRTYTNDEGRQQVVANDGDCITIQGSSTNIWIDHSEFYNKDPKTQTNQDLYDGLIDAKGSSAYITLSWNYFHDHHKTSLVGSSDSDNFDRKMTFHHNYYYNIKERMPSYRFGTAHIYNNYYKSVLSSAVNSRMGACVRVEKNHFEDTKDPIVTKNSSTPGKWQAIDNNYVNTTSQPTNATCTLSVPYSYTAEDKTTVKATVLQGAGIGKI